MNLCDLIISVYRILIHFPYSVTDLKCCIFIVICFLLQRLQSLVLELKKTEATRGKTAKILIPTGRNKEIVVDKDSGYVYMDKKTLQSDEDFLCRFIKSSRNSPFLPEIFAQFHLICYFFKFALLHGVIALPK